MPGPEFFALSAVRLDDSKFWLSWFNNLRQLAEAHGIWDHINPDAGDDSVPPLLTRPLVPEDESGCQLFMAQNAAYEFQSRGLQAVTKYLLDTVDEIYRVYMEAGKDIRERLCILKKMVAPTMEMQYEDAEDRYNFLVDEYDPMCQDLAAWAERFKLAKYKCSLLDVGSSEEVHIKDFLEVAEDFDPQFTSQFQRKLKITDSTTAEEVALKFLSDLHTRKPKAGGLKEAKKQG